MKRVIPKILALGLAAASAVGAEEVLDGTRDELDEMNELEQTAFFDGDCDTVVGLLADEITFYVNGRRMDRQDVLEFCRRIPRPFPANGEAETRIEAVDDGAGYVVKVTTFPGTPKIEVVTKIWKRGDDGWKIVHFQSTVLPPRGPPGRAPGGS